MPKVLVKSSGPNQASMKNLYDVCNQIFTSNNLFYTSDQVEKLRQDDHNIFL